MNVAQILEEFRSRDRVVTLERVTFGIGRPTYRVKHVELLDFPSEEKGREAFNRLSAKKANSTRVSDAKGSGGG